MTKIRTLDDLRNLRTNLRQGMDMRENADNPDSVVQIKVAMATCGIASGAKKTMDFFVTELRKRQITALVTQTGCMGYCYAEPTIEVTIPGKTPVVFGNVTENVADEIIEKYIKKGELVDGIIPQTFNPIDK